MLTTTTSTARNITGYLSGFSSPSVTEYTIARASAPTSNSAGHTRLPTFSMTSRSRSVEREAREPGADHHGVEVALAAEAGARVDERDRRAEAVEPVGVEARGDVAFEDADAHPIGEGQRACA